METRLHFLSFLDNLDMMGLWQLSCILRRLWHSIAEDEFLMTQTSYITSLEILCLQNLLCTGDRNLYLHHDFEFSWKASEPIWKCLKLYNMPNLTKKIMNHSLLPPRLRFISIKSVSTKIVWGQMDLSLRITL